MTASTLMQSTQRRPQSEMTVRMNEMESISAFSVKGTHKIPDEHQTFDER